MNTQNYFFYKAAIYNGLNEATTRTQGVYIAPFRETPDQSFSNLLRAIASDIKCNVHEIDLLQFNFLCSI